MGRLCNQRSRPRVDRGFFLLLGAIESLIMYFMLHKYARAFDDENVS